ncbi:ribosomal protection-like ABC-F family protein [Paenibacillus protaetiae]|uniref:ABC transporter ATP-binding protein n=1 Tax=Paenibacillus protaetiae TaxID=2509456 RepID=A0A4P6ES84_9BACL|nr:ABC-F family ATP-binding cassette domain-containing protein [Paenibacillus protaetiae]QAY65782.1 ABC transporter ATP-binding protein [Paenibacillus protaetiae]
MIIVNLQQVQKYNAANLVLDGVTFQLQAGEKVALIGRNGSGKSTLLQLLSGAETADSGSVSIKKDLHIGYLPQIPSQYEHMTVYEVLASGFLELTGLKQQMAELEYDMASSDTSGHARDLDRLLTSYTSVQENFERLGGYEMDASIDQVANGLQIDRSRDSGLFSSLSGGEKTRVVLASQLVARPELLLLDEPTNHLDLKGIEWLEQYLRRYDGACVIVSHDRQFLDAVVTKLIELEEGESCTYPTNYSGYMLEKEQRLLQQFDLYQEQQKKIKKMKETIRQLEEWGKIGGNDKFFKRAASIRKALSKIDMVKRPVLEQKNADFSVSMLDRSGKRVISFEQLTKRFGNRLIVEQAEGSLLFGDKIALVGGNGTGKTTFLHLLRGALAPDEGLITQGSRLVIGYLAQQEPVPNEKQSVLDYFRTEEALEEGEARRELARYLFYGTHVFKPLQSLSGGEWTRLRLAMLMRKKPNLLLLDEPTNHLDIASREALEEALEDFPGTVFAISHDRYFINRLAKQIWEIENARLLCFSGHYEDYKAKRDQLRSHKPGELHKQPGKKFEQPSKGKEKDRTQSSEQLLKHITAIEADLARLDSEIARLSDSAELKELAAKWEEREALQIKLDERTEQWLKLSE